MSLTLTEAQLARMQALEMPDGTLTAEAVLADAMQPESPLHSQPGFIWDDAKAAHDHRLNHARRFIRIRYLHHTTETLMIAAPHYVRDPSKGNEPGYVALAVLKTDDERARLAVRQECARAEAALSRAYVIASALGVMDEIQDLLHRLAVLKTKLDAVNEDESATISGGSEATL